MVKGQQKGCGRQSGFQANPICSYRLKHFVVYTIMSVPRGANKIVLSTFSIMEVPLIQGSL